MNFTLVNWTSLDDEESSKLMEFFLHNEDDFKELFENTFENVAIVGLYVIGNVSCAGLLLVSWFEKSGQAGPYRTLVNQLASMRLDNLVLLHTVGSAPSILRHVFGPQPALLCKVAYLVSQWAVVNACHLSVIIAGAKFVFAYVYKSMPIMDDKLWSRVVMVTTYTWSTLAVLSKWYTDENVGFLEKIGTGTWMDFYEGKRLFPLTPIVATYSLALLIPAAIAVKIKKKTGGPTQTNYNNGQSMDLANKVHGMIITFCIMFMVVAFGIVSRKVKQPSDLTENQMIRILRAMLYPCLVIMVTVQALHYFITNKFIRRAAWQLFFPVQVVPIDNTH